MAPDKNKLKELIQKSATKDILYLHINPLEPKSLQTAIKEINKFIKKENVNIIITKIF